MAFAIVQAFRRTDQVMATLPTPPTTADAPVHLLQSELTKLKVLVQEYGRLDAGTASDTDLSARFGRIGGRMQAILQFERELVLPRLDDGALRRCGQAQSDDVLQHLERLAAQSAEDQPVSTDEMLALSQHFDAHMQLLLERLWPCLEQQERLPIEEELAEWRARWQQEEAAD